MSSVFAISSSLMKRSIPFCCFSSGRAKLCLPLSVTYNPILRKTPMCLSARLLGNEQGKSPPEFPEFPEVPSYQPAAPLEVPPMPTTPEIDPGNTPSEVKNDPPPFTTPGPIPGPEFPRPPIPPQPDPGPELPKPIIPPRPDPDIPLPKPDVVPPHPPDYVPPRPPAPDVVPPPPSTPPPDISPPPGPYIV